MSVFLLAWSIGHCGICSKDLNKFCQIFSQHPYIYHFRYVLLDSNKNNQLKPLFKWKRFEYPIAVLIQRQLQTNKKCFEWRIVLITCKWYSCINNWGENILVNIHVVGCYIVDLGKCVSCLKKADAKKTSVSLIFNRLLKPEKIEIYCYNLQMNICAWNTFHIWNFELAHRFLNSSFIYHSSIVLDWFERMETNFHVVHVQKKIIVSFFIFQF